MKPLVLLLIVIHIHSTLTQGTTTVEEEPGVVIYHPGVTTELTCDVNPGAGWRVNNVSYFVGQLQNGNILGHDVNGSNILITSSPMNDSEYVCTDGTNFGGIYRIIVAGVPAVVPGITGDIMSVNLGLDIVTLTLSWREPFNNFDPILNYTVSCLGDVTCPPTYTTTSNRVIITNLTVLTNYTFSVVATNSIGSGEAGILNYTTPDVPAKVPDVKVNTTTIDGNIVTHLTLNWGEPSDNLDPIVNYTVLCSGDAMCPQNPITTNNATRSYTITNLTPMTNYTFSVVATNSIGSGEAGIVMITTPAIDQVTGVNLICKPMDLVNKCNVTWDAISQDVERYQVYLNESRGSSTSTSLSLTAPSVSTDVFTDTVVVTVIAFTRYGFGPASDPKTSMITASSVTDVDPLEPSLPNNISEPYNIKFRCTIHRYSTANECVVIAVNNGTVTATGDAPVINKTAIVTINGLECTVNYTIIARGTLNGSLVGPMSSHDSINESCSLPASNISDNEGCEDGCIAGIVIGVVAVASGGIIIALAAIAYIRYKKKGKVSQDKGDDKHKTKKMSKDKDTLKQQLQDDKADSPEAKNMDVYAEVNKGGGDSVKAKQMGQLNYADLDLQRGPNRYGDDCHAVEYGQVAETKQ